MDALTELYQTQAGRVSGVIQEAAASLHNLLIRGGVKGRGVSPLSTVTDK